MAEACRTGNSDTENKTSSNQNENFCVFNVLCVFISLVSILADLTTDIIVFAEYCKDGHSLWALGSFIFIFSPNVLVNVFSLRWFLIDQTCNLRHWITHGCFVGLLERYISFLHKVFVCKNWGINETQKLLSERNDLCLLHFLYIFTGTLPQIILQFYAIIVLDENYHTKVFSLSASIASVVWGCATYIYSITVFSKEKLNWNAILLKYVWHFCMLISRVQGILLFTVLLDIWTLLPLGLHWSAMTVWIIIQNTKFCPNKCEETLYNIVMGFVYCFIYVNIREGHTRYRLLMFYTLILTQNFGSLLLYVFLGDPEQQMKLWSIATTVGVVVGSALGMSAMVLYYRFFHPTGPIWWKNVHNDVELNNKSVINSSNVKSDVSSLKTIRSFKKSFNTQGTGDMSKASVQEGESKENNKTDKTFLLDHWIARSGTPTFSSAPVGNTSMNASSVEIYTVENTPQPQTDTKQFNNKPVYQKSSRKRTICAPTALNLQLSSLESIESSIDELTSSNSNLYKRRGICSPGELKEELNNLNFDISNLLNEDFLKMIKAEHGSEISHDTDGSNKKTSSDSIDMDLDLSFSDINSSDINTFNENIVQKLCISALKNIKVGNQDADIENIQRIALDILKEMYARKDRRKSQSLLMKSRDIDTPTEALSVHDYENMCAINIAREAWGLRSWKGYTDIENWVHDGSVVRDRRRDTLTSGSSEVSSCISQELKSAMSFAQPFPKKSHTYSNVFVKFDRTDQDDYGNTVICQDDTFLAKPCVTDISKDINHLEPILEELDDLGDIDPANKKRLNSESSLVATIDEIRKCTITNSPRNLYHRRENNWDSPQLKNSSGIDSHLKKVLWKEPSKFDSSNIMDPIHEKTNFDRITESKISKNEMNLYTPENVNHAHCNRLDLSKNEMQSSIHRNNTLKRINSGSHENVHHAPDDNIEHLLWQIVSDDSVLPNPLESYKNKDMSGINGPHKINNIKKNSKNRPRRKFSILRDRFEPGINIHSDEEALFHSNESILNLNSSEGSIVNLKNQFDDNKNPNTCTLINNRKIVDAQDIFKEQQTHISPPNINSKLIRHKV